MFTRESLTEFYSHVYPVDLITTWLSYDFSPFSQNFESSQLSHLKRAKSGDYDDSEEDEETKQRLKTQGASIGYLSRREFCFTLIGDIFTRFRSYGNSSELKSELIRCFPEKIDVGAVYNIRPNQKQGVSNVFPLERELVFDIDMSDYDNVRSCCSGKCICFHCWTWMTCAAEVLKYLLEDDFGFQYILPVFSGRRGIHLWVCDKRARQMTDDERAALVGYLTVVTPKTMRSSVIADLANHRPIHPSIRRIYASLMNDSFMKLFIESSEENPNNIQTHPKAAAIVFNSILSVLKLGHPESRKKVLAKIQYKEGDVIDWYHLRSSLGDLRETDDILFAVQILLMYPRLDEHVSTRRDHLLKLPFCVHPGTSFLCCPLEWGEALKSFNPTEDAPKLEELLMTRRIEEKWLAPLTGMVLRMAKDPLEASN